jgi:hypothetical protein
MALGDGILGNVILGDTGGGGGIASLDAALLFFSIAKTSANFILQSPEVIFSKSITALGFTLTAPNVTFTMAELKTGAMITHP